MLENWGWRDQMNKVTILAFQFLEIQTLSQVKNTFLTTKKVIQFKTLLKFQKMSSV